MNSTLKIVVSLLFFTAILLNLFNGGIISGISKELYYYLMTDLIVLAMAGIILIAFNSLGRNQ